MFIACDESGILSSDKFLVIGTVWVTKIYLQTFEKKICELRLRHKCWGEFKFTKIKPSISEDMLQAYKELIKTTLLDKEFVFRFMIVKKTLVNKIKYHKNSDELMKIKFMSLLIRNHGKKMGGSIFHILFDNWEESNKSKEERWRENMRDFVRKDISLEHLQPCDSKICSLLQLCDFLTGAVSRSWNNKRGANSKKIEMINFIEDILEKQIDKQSPYNENKFNIWAWRPPITYS